MQDITALIGSINHPTQTAILSLNEKLGFKREFGYVTMDRELGMIN